MDFVVDCLDSGRRFRVLTVVDLFTRKCLAIGADVGLTGRRVARILDTIAVARRYPTMLTVDNVSELHSKEIDQWAFGTACGWTSSVRESPSKTPSSTASTSGFGTSA